MLRVEGLADIDNRGLLLLHSHINLFRQDRLSKPMRALRSLVRKRRRDQLAAYGIPQVEAQVRILGKLETNGIRLFHMNYLLQTLRNAQPRVVKILHHLPILNRVALRILTDDVLLSAVTPKFIREFSAGRKSNPALLMDTLNMACQLGRRLGSISSVRQLNHLHDMLTEDLNNLQDFGGPIPMAPFPGLPGKVWPLDSAEKIFEHGRRQRNCIRSYIGQVRRGTLYLYGYKSLASGHSEEVGTFSILRHYQGGWQLGEVRKKFNELPDWKTVGCLNEWLRKAQMKGVANSIPGRQGFWDRDIDIEQRFFPLASPYSQLELF